MNGIEAPTVNGSGITNGCGPAVSKPRRTLTALENERVAKAIEDIDGLAFSDVESSNFDEEKELYKRKSKKRALEVDEIEIIKRKVWIVRECLIKS